jgi:hypothetical protein
MLKLLPKYQCSASKVYFLIKPISSKQRINICSRRPCAQADLDLSRSLLVQLVTRSPPEPQKSRSEVAVIAGRRILASVTLASNSLDTIIGMRVQTPASTGGLWQPQELILPPLDQNTTPQKIGLWAKHPERPGTDSIGQPIGSNLFTKKWDADSRFAYAYVMSVSIRVISL